MLVPEDLKYAATHEWIRAEEETGVVGITDHAQAELTDIVYVELPAIGSQVEATRPAAVVESVKAASDIYSPVSGTVVEINPELESNPALVNTDPYGSGWLFKVKMTNSAQLDLLKTASGYEAQIGA